LQKDGDHKYARRERIKADKTILLKLWDCRFGAEIHDYMIKRKKKV